MIQKEDWTEPGAHQVAPGVHRIPLPLPHDSLRAVNVYAIETGTDLVLIDAGMAIEECRTRLEQGLSSLGYNLSDISRVLVTHVHGDHYGLAVMLRREFGTKISLGLGEMASLDVIHSRPTADTHPQLRRLREAGAVRLAEEVAELFSAADLVRNLEYPDEWLTASSQISVPGREIIAVPTPGHTQGHVVFADMSSELAFTGDHVLPHITPSVGFESAAGGLPLADFIRSLTTLRALPDLRMLPAHGPTGSSVHSRVDVLLAHHEERLARCQAAVESGLVTAIGVAESFVWTRRRRQFAELEVLNQVLAVTEIAAHLDLLSSQGRIQRRKHEGVVNYSHVRDLR